MQHKYLLHVPATRSIIEIVKPNVPEALEIRGLFFVLACWLVFVLHFVFLKKLSFGE